MQSVIPLYEVMIWTTKKKSWYLRVADIRA